MKAASAFLLRIILAGVMALATVPVANYLVGTATSETEVKPPAAAESATRMLDSLAVQYNVPVPAVRFIVSRAAGYTQPNGTNLSNSTINLGTPLQRPVFQERPDLLQAIVAHEFGHAVMNARNDAFPLLLIIAMYGSGLFILLVVFPTKRGVLLGSALATVILAAMTAAPRWEVVHNAYRDLLIILPFLIGTLWLAKIPVTSRLPLSLVAHLPSRRNFALAALLAAPVFLSAAWAVGGLNTERELRADVIGACATSPQSMKNALLNINDKPPSALDEAFDLDHFHPPMKVRHNVLDALANRDLLKQACDAVMAGNRRLDISGQRIQ